MLTRADVTELTKAHDAAIQALQMSAANLSAVARDVLEETIDTLIDARSQNIELYNAQRSEGEDALPLLKDL